MSKHILLRKLLVAAETMVQGGLSETTRRCGNPGCICYRDPSQKHGPHLYLTYRSEGKSRALYVPAEHAGQAYQAQAAWKEFGEKRGQPCAGINRHVVEDERALQERSSDSILTSSLALFAVARRSAKRRQRH